MIATENVNTCPNIIPARPKTTNFNVYHNPSMPPHPSVSHAVQMTMDSRIVINVSGNRFETLLSTLERFPGTRLSLLSNLREEDESYDPRRGEFFFDRNHMVFASVLEYYRTEELHLDQTVCGNVVRREFEFWGMLEQDIEPCCWTIFSKAQECKETLAAIDDTFLTESIDINAWGEIDSKWILWRRKAWAFLEDPASSLLARIYVFVSMFFVFISIGTFVMETYHGFRVPMNDTVNVTVVPYCPRCCGMYVDPDKRPGYEKYDLEVTKPMDILVYIDLACFVFFLIELIARIFFTPSFKKYFFDILNIIDIICVVTHLVAVVMTNLENLGTHGYANTLVKTVLTLRILRALRIVRVLRIFKLVKHYNAFRILVYTIRMSVRELMLMIVFLISGAVLFGSVIHVIDKENFTSIYIGIWWALVTMTTVGYGEIVPREPGGYLLGCVCVIFGVLTIAFTVPIVVNNFALYYTHAQSRNKKPKSYWRHKRIPADGFTGSPHTGKNPTPEPPGYYTGVQEPPHSRSPTHMNHLNNLDRGTKATKISYPDKQVLVDTPVCESTDSNINEIPAEDLSASMSHPPIRYVAYRPPTAAPTNINTAADTALQHEEQSRQLLAAVEEAEKAREEEKRRQTEAAEEAKRRAAAAKAAKQTDATEAAPEPEPAPKKKKKKAAAAPAEGQTQPTTTTKKKKKKAKEAPPTDDPE